jgi:hypothetical protein
MPQPPSPGQRTPPSSASSAAIPSATGCGNRRARREQRRSSRASCGRRLPCSSRSPSATRRAASSRAPTRICAPRQRRSNGAGRRLGDETREEAREPGTPRERLARAPTRSQRSSRRRRAGRAGASRVRAAPAHGDGRDGCARNGLDALSSPVASANARDRSARRHAEGSSSAASKPDAKGNARAAGDAEMPPEPPRAPSRWKRGDSRSQRRGAA